MCVPMKSYAMRVYVCRKLFSSFGGRQMRAKAISANNAVGYGLYIKYCDVLHNVEDFYHAIVKRP